MPSFLGYDLRILILEALPWRDFLMNTNHCWLILCVFVNEHKKKGAFKTQDMDISENSGTPKSSILIGVSIINHPFWGTPIFGKAHMYP